MSEIRANTISDAAGTGPIDLYKQSAAKAWINFNGTGTIAARDSFNSSSLTDVGVGRYSVNFSSNLANTNYAVTGAIPYATWGAAVRADLYAGADSASFMGLTVILPYSSWHDGTSVYAVAHGDLA